MPGADDADQTSGSTSTNKTKSYADVKSKIGSIRPASGVNTSKVSGRVSATDDNEAITNKTAPLKRQQTGRLRSYTTLTNPINKTKKTGAATHSTVIEEATSDDGGEGLAEKMFGGGGGFAEEVSKVALNTSRVT